MNGEMSTTWLAITVISSAVGMGMLVYGRKQREAVPLVFGFAIAGYPYLVHTAWLAALVGVGLVAAFLAIRKYR